MILACQKIEKAFGVKSLLNNVNFLINEVFFTISIIPFHKQIVPKNVIDNCTASEAELNIPSFISFTLPAKIAYIKEITINAGHITFII